MKRVDRYLLSEMVLPYLGGLLLIVVMLIGNTLYPLIQLIVQNGIPFMVVAKLVVFNIPTLLVLTLPAGMALSAAWAVNRLARDSEITAVRIAGVPLLRLFLPIFLVGLVSSGISFWIGDYVVPGAQHEFERTQEEMTAYAIQASPTVAANKVFTYQNYAFHISRIVKDRNGDTNKLKLIGVTLFENPSETGFPKLITAQTADYDHDIWTLHHVVVHLIASSGFNNYTIVGKKMTLNLRVPLNDLAASEFSQPDEHTMKELGAQMSARMKTGQDYTAIAVEFYTKLSLPFVCFAFALCAPPLAFRFARAGAYVGIFLSIVMVWVAWNTLLLAKYLGFSGKLSPFMAAWSPDILFLVVGIGLLWRMERAQ